ncbi:MAG TPA: phosphate regulon transcriptional regulator PhoB [Burkholderiaceae bacterium]|jgi:two-component system phosphate regulon response regulator PhoB|nr:phosphate regulon transcriptional regulator PhoB [Burkholderiaceae bacterium]
MNARILVVEDEPAIRELLSVNLRHAGYAVTEAETADQARRLLDAGQPDLVLLDWMLPGQSGIDFAKQLRADPRTAALPIVMLTARAQEGDKLQGFDVGADDYVTKPFSPRELLARVRALLRRATPETSEDPIEIAGLRLEPATFRVFADGTPLELSPTEFRLLHYFMKNPDRVLSRAKLLDNVWGDRVYIEERTVDVHIRRLRLALAPAGHDRLVETVRGGGYRFLPR